MHADPNCSPWSLDLSVCMRCAPGPAYLLSGSDVRVVSALVDCMPARAGNAQLGLVLTPVVLLSLTHMVQD